MSIEQVKAGDYVRVTIESRVAGVYPDCFYLNFPEGPYAYVPYGDGGFVSIEKIPEPEDWKVGDIVRTANDSVLLRIDDQREPWMILSSPVLYWERGETTFHAHPARPLKLLVRNGEVVTK